MPGDRTAFQSLYKAGNKAWQAAIGRRPKKPRRRYKYVKGVYKGNYYRRRLPDSSKPMEPTVPKLPIAGPAVMPKPLTQVPTPTAVVTADAGTASTTTSGYWSRLFQWFRQNAPVLILNFGSLCTLTGFLRQDVLELRALSMTGSLSFCVYQGLQPPPTRWAPILWSALFATVNGFNISKILVERNAKVVLDEHEQKLFVEHFMPHGVTPKQFEKILAKAKTRRYNKGQVIVQQGHPLDKVWLIAQGSTRATIGGRRLTAASSRPTNRTNLHGGDSGAWVGEMAFLELFGQEEMKKYDDSSNDKPQNQRRLGLAIYTIVAQCDNVEVLEWSHEDIKDLMHISNDMRAAMTRAMTAPIVGKVINFSVSRTTSMPTWALWLNDWKDSGANVKTTLVEDKKEEEAKEEDSENKEEDDNVEEVYPVM